MRSHSQAPASVSSKSLMSNRRSRSGRGEEAEVDEVRVAADLDGDAAERQRGDVRGHHQRPAAEEGEGRGAHPPVAHRDQLRDAGRGLAPGAGSTGSGRSAAAVQPARAEGGTRFRAAAPAALRSSRRMTGVDMAGHLPRPSAPASALRRLGPGRLRRRSRRPGIRVDGLLQASRRCSPPRSSRSARRRRAASGRPGRRSTGPSGCRGHPARCGPGAGCPLPSSRGRRWRRHRARTTVSGGSAPSTMPMTSSVKRVAFA